MRADTEGCALNNIQESIIDHLLGRADPSPVCAIDVSIELSARLTDTRIALGRLEAQGLVKSAWDGNLLKWELA